MGDWVPNDGFHEDDEYENEEFSYKRGREGTIYLIDADKNLLEDPELFREYLNCIEQDLLRNIMINANDLVSVVFYNTEKSPAPNEIFCNDDALPVDVVPKNCAVLIPLMQMNKEVIQYFKNFRESVDFFDFLNKYGVSDTSSFSEALWLCSRTFIRCSRQLVNSKIILFTANDQPHMPGSQQLQQTFIRAEDLKMTNTTIDLVPLVENDDDFDMELFYIEFLCAVNGIEDKDEFRWHKPSDQRYLLENRLYRRNYRKNCLRHIKWELGDGLAIGCDVHSFTRSALKPTAIKIDRATNDVIISKRSQVAITSTETINADVDVAASAVSVAASAVSVPDSGIGSSGNAIRVNSQPQIENEINETKAMPGQIYKSQSVCGSDILFNLEEMTNLKSIMHPGIRLLGFKPITTLKTRWFVKHHCFLYPDESKIKGSTKLFRALWERCMEKEKYALCVITMQRKSTPRYIALVPQTQEDDKNDGFRVIHLPVETNLSYLDATNVPAPEVPDEMVRLFERMCKKFRFLFSPSNFANPSLKAFYAQIEALVFDENEPEVGDDTLPDVAHQDGVMEAFIQEFHDLFEKVHAAKRGNDDANDGGRAKSSKKELSMTDVENAIRMDQDKAVTVQHLKDFIKMKRASPPSNAVKKNLFEFAKRLID